MFVSVLIRCTPHTNTVTDNRPGSLSVWGLLKIHQCDVTKWTRLFLTWYASLS